MTDHSSHDDTSPCRPVAGCVLPASGSGRGHLAVLQEADRFDMLRRKDDLLDEGVSAVFGLRRGEAELQALCFDADRFTSGRAREWLLA